MVPFFERVLSILRVSAQFSPFDNLVAQPVGNTSGQLARRGRDIHFARYQMHDKDERKAFAGAVQYLLERVPLTCDLDAFLKRWRWFAECCPSRAGSQVRL